MRTPWLPRDYDLGNDDPEHLFLIIQDTYSRYAYQHWEAHTGMLDLAQTAIGQALFGVKTAIQEGHCE